MELFDSLQYIVMFRCEGASSIGLCYIRAARAPDDGLRERAGRSPMPAARHWASEITAGI